MGGHGGPPLHLLLAYINTLGVNVGVALRGHPFVDFFVYKTEVISWVNASLLSIEISTSNT